MIKVIHRDMGNLKAPFYFSLEFYILEKILKDDEIYFFTWPIEGVVFGKNQIIENEVNLDYVKKEKINVFRRPSGGGAIFADKNNLMFSIIKKKTKDFTFKMELQRIVDALNKIGVPATFSGRNDIIVNDLKVSGNSFIQNKHGIIIHGTLLFDTDVEKMVRSLNPDNEKLISKGIESVKSRVLNMKSILVNDNRYSFREKLEKELETSRYVLSDKEINNILEDSKKYFTHEWIYREQPEHTKKISKRLEAGLIEVHVSIAYGVLRSIDLYGDFFEKVPLDDFINAFKGIKFNEEEIKKVLNKNDISSYIINLTNEEFYSLLEEMMK